MTSPMILAVYVVALIAVVVGVDVLFFRDQFWERLIANIGIVLVFAAFYLRTPETPVGPTAGACAITAVCPLGKAATVSRRGSERPIGPGQPFALLSLLEGGCRAGSMH